MIETFYSDFINQPRSKLKLPVDELIKERKMLKRSSAPLLSLATLTAENDNQLSTQISVSMADKLLQVLRSDNCTLIPRLETFREISREYALNGSFEKAESLILNMKKDCNLQRFIKYYYSHLFYISFSFYFSRC